MRLARLFGLWAACVLPFAATAQEWFTADYCDVSDVTVTRAQLDATLSEAADTAIPAPANGQGRLWQITAPSGAVSHLWGTWHSSAPRVLQLPPETRDALGAARLVALESDPRPADRDHLRRVFSYEDWWQNDLLPPTGLPIWDGADPQISDWIFRRLLATGHQVDAIFSYTPGAFAVGILADPCEDFSLGFIPIQDSYIQTLAHVNGTPVLGLESVFRLFDVLNAPGNGPLAAAIVTSYGAYLTPDVDKVERATYLSLYAAGEIGALMQLDTAYLMDALGPRASEAIALMNGDLLDTRNAGWITRITPELETGGVFMAVGAFHLPGEAGLINLLRNAGHNVTRIPTKGEG